MAKLRPRGETSCLGPIAEKGVPLTLDPSLMPALLCQGVCLVGAEVPLGLSRRASGRGVRWRGSWGLTLLPWEKAHDLRWENGTGSGEGRAAL